MKAPKYYAFLLFLTFCLLAPAAAAQTVSGLAGSFLSDTSGFFYIDAKNYPAKNKKLPVGIFDSGTGGLTVMDAIVNFDGFNNESGSGSPDGIPDFNKECFVYLADQANMPYGNYPSVNNTELLKEHILKDMQFLLNNKYYRSGGDTEYLKDKLPSKAIVVACNTATAYGIEDIQNFIEHAGLDIKVIGVINAGVKGALQLIEKDEECSIGVMATEGTVLSNGYLNTINKMRSELGYGGEIQTYQQPGVGLAGAIDGVADYMDLKAAAPRKDYRGPSLTSDAAPIDKAILNRYGFSWDNNDILYSGSKENPSEVQLNSIENYISYNIVSLLEQLKRNPAARPLKTIILGCTHYPFYKEVFAAELDRLYNLKEDGEYVYRHLMHEKIALIDPAVNTAEELYDYLNANNLFAEEPAGSSEFYISVPNTANNEVELDGSGNFTYDYKYGRKPGRLQEYVKPVPFSSLNINSETIKMLRTATPRTYELIKEFNRVNPKTEYIRTAGKQLPE